MAAMSTDTLARIVLDGYLAQSAGWAGDNHWTWLVLEELIENRPDVAWPLLLEIVRRAPDDALDLIAAGPLEDYIAQHGHRVIATVEAEAAVNPRLRRALAGMWPEGTPAPVWSRVEALMEPPEGEDDEPPEWVHRQVDVMLEALPPMHPGDVTPEALEARATLLDALAAARLDGPEPWPTPVAVELTLETGEGEWGSASTDVLHAVIEAMALDRAPGLVPDRLASGGVVATRSLVREARVTELRSRVPGYRIRVQRLIPEQLEAMDDVRDLDELLEDPDVQALMAELGIEVPSPDDD
jgi:hypothetical protein